jgi:uncharacterized RDD family membrane protein YckC
VSDERFAAPRAAVADTASTAPVRYVGFWARVLASLIDTVLMAVLVIPLAMLVAPPHVRRSIHAEIGFGLPDDDVSLASLTVNWILPAVVVLVFWFTRGATPGKMAISAEIVDADTLQKPTRRQFVVRYLGYFVSTMGLLLGLVWVGIDARKQGWHDKMASTVVVRRPR